MPGFRELLRQRRERVGQRPADAGAAEHRRRLVHARHGRVAGRRPARPTTRSTSTAQPFANRTAASHPGVLQAETLAQSAERGGKKVAQIEWAGGRSGAIDGPTLDFRNFRSGRGVATNYIVAHRQRRVHGVVRAAVRPSRRIRRAAAVRRRPSRPPRPAGPTSPPPTARRRRCACACSTPAIDKYGLNAYIYDSGDDGETRYDRVLFSTTKDGDDAVGDLREGEWADVKVKIQGGDLDGKTGGMLVKVERLAADLSEVRLFHTSVTRAIALVAELAGRARASAAASRTTSPSASRPRRPATSRCSRRASSARTPTSSRAATGRRSTAR